MTKQKVSPFLWYDGQAQQAAEFYVSLFPDSKVTGIMPRPDGTAFVVEFQLAGMQYIALNGGPHFQLNEAFSLSIDCETQEEVDHYWEKLTAGGTESHCGWLKDKFGLSWQVVPSVLPKLLGDPDQAKASRVMNAMMQMGKLDIQSLQDAADGRDSQ